MFLKKLCIGDTIGIIAPAFNSTDSLNEKIDFIKEQGFNVEIGKHVYNKYGYLAGQDKERRKDLEDMFLNDKISAIFSIRAGYGCMRLLPLIDINIIRNNPKLFVGYSDITCLLNYFNKKGDFITFHGPMASSDFLNYPLSFEILINLLSGKTNNINFGEFSDVKSNSSDVVHGKLVGGNLSLIAATMGTPYETVFENNILFLEEIEEEPYSVDRLLTQLLISGKLDKVKGIILGDFTDCNDRKNFRGFSIKEVLSDRLESLNIPILYNIKCGHISPSLTLPIGATVSVDYKCSTMTLLDDFFNSNLV